MAAYVRMFISMILAIIIANPMKDIKIRLAKVHENIQIIVPIASIIKNSNRQCARQTAIPAFINISKLITADRSSSLSHPFMG